VVAVVGHINRAKGADLLRAMARHAEASAKPVRFVVLGSLEGGGTGGSNLRIAGQYTQGELCERLTSAQAALAFLPSVCPETYSYVTDELMATGLPLAVLDRGAPAERVARYARGCVLAGDDPADLLEQLLEFAAAQRDDHSIGSPS
jgi:glycosyltransferase involved in cell wall biosynthesis